VSASSSIILERARVAETARDTSTITLSSIGHHGTETVQNSRS
jgi:hypothetical protein